MSKLKCPNCGADEISLEFVEDRKCCIAYKIKDSKVDYTHSVIDSIPNVYADWIHCIVCGGEFDYSVTITNGMPYEISKIGEEI